MKKRSFLLIFIIGFFLVTRLYKINEVPPALYWDEASIGYNAYSVLKTGKDEWGQSFPIHFKAFGEYKLPVYIYSVLLFEKIFGLNEFSVRFPAVLFSLIIIYITFLTAKEISKKDEIALLSAFILSVSPWFFIFSRSGYEAVAGLAFYMLGVYLALKSIKEIKLLPISTLCFTVSLYSYNSFRILVPITLLLLFFYIERKYKQPRKKLFFIFTVSATVFVFSLIPIIELWLSGGASRMQAVGIFNPIDTKKQIALEFIKNYLSHFSLGFLLKGDINLRSQINGFGQVYLIDLLIIIFGLSAFLGKKIRGMFLITILAFLGPIPAAITRESPHALRSIASIPFIAMISAFGVVYLGEMKKKIPWTLLVILIYSGLFTNYFFNFLTAYPAKSAEHWQYGYKEIFTKYQDKFSGYDSIVVSDMYNQPYIFALFYLKYDPDKFRLEGQKNTSKRKATSLVRGFNKFIFSNIDFYNFPKGKSLVFAHPSEKLTEISAKEMILNPDESVAFYVYEYQK